MRNEYLPQEVKILEKRKQLEDSCSFRLAWKVRSEPGQIMEASVPLIGEAPFGFASYGKDYVEILIRDVGNVSNGLTAMEEGDTMFVRGPYGHGFPMEKARGKNLYIVAGGTGIAPIKAVIECILSDRKAYGDVHVFLGFRSPEQLIFKEHFEQWKKEINLHISVDEAKGKCPYEVCRVTELLGKADIGENSMGFTCGPPTMMNFAAKGFMEKGLKEDEIYVSMERNMHCGIGKCGRCMVDGIFICKDGPVFPYSIARSLED